MKKEILLLHSIKQLKKRLQLRKDIYGSSSIEGSFDPSFKFIKKVSEVIEPKLVEEVVEEKVERVESDRSEKIAKTDEKRVEIDPHKVQILPEIEEINKLYSEVIDCRGCGLHKSRTNTVFGTGSGKRKLLCIGEAPGEDEDRSGIPFVGKAGQLLTKMLSAINIAREDIFICNVLKCRPPYNRDPFPEEVKSCYRYLDKQIELLRPNFILALGRVAAIRILGVEKRMAEFREGKFEYKGIPVIITYHPSALLRNPKWKRPAWEDLQLLQKMLEESERG